MSSVSGGTESFADDLIGTEEKSVFAEEPDHFFELLSVVAGSQQFLFSIRLISE